MNVKTQLKSPTELSSITVSVTLSQFNSVAQWCLTLCDPMDCSTPGFPVHHQLPEFTQTHVHRVGDAIQPSHPLSSPSPPAFNLSQHQGLFQRVSSSHQVALVLEFQLQHQSSQLIFKTGLGLTGLIFLQSKGFCHSRILCMAFSCWTTTWARAERMFYPTFYTGTMPSTQIFNKGLLT